MSVISIAIDGACRGNGKADCVSGAGVFIRNISKGTKEVRLAAEANSTNQRGELLALLQAFKYLSEAEKQDPIGSYQIITDSEYIFNTMTKEWYKGWQANNWKTKAGTPVKNRDLWEQIVDIYDELLIESEVAIYHLKGHVIPIGAVTALGLYAKDNTAAALYAHCSDKFEAVKHSKKASEMIKKAQALSLANNGFKIAEPTLKMFVAMNCTADILANVAVDELNLKLGRA